MSQCLFLIPSPKPYRNPNDICTIFSTRPIVDVANPYHGLYNALLCGPFPIVQFATSLDFLDHNLDAMTLYLKTTRETRKPVFILLIAPDDTPATCRHAEVTMLKLLKQASGRGLKVMHGVCVYESRASFYQYDRKQQLFSPEPQGQVYFDLGQNLATEDGAVGFLQVADDVKQMCREFIPDLEVSSYLHIPEPQ